MRIAPYRMQIRRPERGIALVLVIFIVALSSVLVVNLAYSTYLDSRVSTAVQRTVQAEYLLKSALNFARALIQVDDPNIDSPDDDWAKFYDGREVPLEYFGINIPNLRLTLEIRTEDTKLRVNAVNQSGKPDWKKIFTSLFQGFDFDNDNELDQSGFFPKKHFKSDELMAALVDYQDLDSDSYQPNGVEKDLPKEIFPNTAMVRLTELSSVPGFTPSRVRKVLPYLTTHGGKSLNINFIGGVGEVESRILSALHPDIDGPAVAAKLRERAMSQTPWQSGSDPDLNNIFPSTMIADVGLSIFQAYSSEFQIIAKVDYDTSAFFLRAFVYRNRATGSTLPEIRSVELY